MWGGHKEHISECKVNPSLERHSLASQLVEERETDEALAFCLHRTGAMYFHREEMVLDTAKKKALLRSGFSGLDLFGDTKSKLLLQNLSYPQSSWEHFSHGSQALLSPSFLTEGKGKLPLTLKYKRILTLASCVNPKPFAKETLFEGLRLEEESTALFLWVECSSPAARAASWPISGRFMRNTGICKVISTWLRSGVLN